MTMMMMMMMMMIPDYIRAEPYAKIRSRNESEPLTAVIAVAVSLDFASQRWHAVLCRKLHGMRRADQNGQRDLVAGFIFSLKQGAQSPADAPFVIRHAKQNVLGGKTKLTQAMRDSLPVLLSSAWGSNCRCPSAEDLELPAGRTACEIYCQVMSPISLLLRFPTVTRQRELATFITVALQAAPHLLLDVLDRRIYLLLQVCLP